MGSSFHYAIDLNEDQNHQPFFSSLHHNHNHQQAPSNPSFSSSYLTSPSLSYLPFLINSHQDQVHVGYNNNTFHGFLDPHLSQPLETKKIEFYGGSSSSDQMVPKEKTRLKLTIRKKDNHQDHIDLPRYPTKGETETNSLKWISSKVRLMKRKMMITTTDSNNQSSNLSNLEKDHLKKTSKNQYDNENGYNGSSNCMIRICSDCNTTKTPLWRSGPRGPKSLCNACGIRQRKARQAATAAPDVLPPLLKQKKMQNKNKRCKMMTTSSEATIAEDLESQNKFYFDDLASRSSAYQQVFPQDEKEAAILLMALSYGMVHG